MKRKNLQSSPCGIQRLLLTCDITTFRVCYLLAPAGNIARCWKTSCLQEPPCCITKDNSTELQLSLHCHSPASKRDLSTLGRGTVILHLTPATEVRGCFKFRKLQMSLKALWVGGIFLFSLIIVITIFILSFITTRKGIKDEKEVTSSDIFLNSVLLHVVFSPAHN